MFNFINQEYPALKSLYDYIYNQKNYNYFDDVNTEISDYCRKNNIVYKNFSAGT